MAGAGGAALAQTSGQAATPQKPVTLPPRKFYRISPDGERLATELVADWGRIDASVRRLAKGGRTA